MKLRSPMVRVAVIVPVFNNAATLARAIDSVLAQSFREFEIVAVDDGSSDASAAILDRYQTSVRVVQQQNRGPSAARNLGIANSSGKYLAFLDADDWWMPDFLARMTIALDTNPRASMAYCDLILADSIGNTFDTSLMRSREARAPSVKDMLDELWPIMPSGAVARRASLDACGGWPEALRAFEDVYLWLLMREQAEFIHLAEPLAVWRFGDFSDELRKPAKQQAAGEIFRRMVRERYSVDPIRHVEARRRAPRSILGYIGLDALARGDRSRAREAFSAAIRIDPWRVKNYLRLIRTWLPSSMAQALTGRSRS